MHARIQIYWCRSSIFRHLKLELLTQFPASNDEKYMNVVYIWRKFVSFCGYVHWRMTTEISVMYGSEKVKEAITPWVLSCRACPDWTCADRWIYIYIWIYIWVHVWIYWKEVLMCIYWMTPSPHLNLLALSRLLYTILMFNIRSDCLTGCLVFIYKTYLKSASMWNLRKSKQINYFLFLFVRKKWSTPSTLFCT